MGILHRLFYGVFYLIRWFVSSPVVGVSLTEACPIRFYSENSGCGVRGAGCGKVSPLMGRQIIYGDFAQAGMMPVITDGVLHASGELPKGEGAYDH